MNDHKDPTAWIAIANVERERRKAERNPPKEKNKKEYQKKDPVDWHRVVASKNKKVRINKAWLFYAEMERILNEPWKKT